MTVDDEIRRRIDEVDTVDVRTLLGNSGIEIEAGGEFNDILTVSFDVEQFRAALKEMLCD